MGDVGKLVNSILEKLYATPSCVPSRAFPMDGRAPATTLDASNNVSIRVIAECTIPEPCADGLICNAGVGGYTCGKWTGTARVV